MKSLNLKVIFEDKIYTKTYLNNLGGVLYRIHHIGTDKNYIGTTKNIIDRMYSDWDGYVTIINNKDTGKYRRIHRALLEFGIDKFELIIEKVGDYDTEIDPYEDYYIELYDSYNNGYNDTRSGKSNNKAGVRYNIKGKTPIYNPDTMIQKFVFPYEIPEYEKLGYVRGHKSKPKTTTSGMTWATNGVINIMIDKNNGILPDGFYFGKIQVPKEKVKFMNNGKFVMRIPESQVNKFLSEGYILGRMNKPGNIGKKSIHNSHGIIKYVYEDELDKFLNSGWELGIGPRSNK